MDLQRGKIVLGGNLESLLYTYKTNSSILLTHADLPFIYDYFDHTIDLSEFGIQSYKELKSNKDTLKVGPPRFQLWQKLFFLLSLSGKVLFGDKTRSVRIEDEYVQVSCDGCRSRKVYYDEIVVFSDENVIGLDTFKKTVKGKNIVYDWVNILSGGSHDYDILNYDDDFVKTVHFYPSERNDNKRYKDLISVSYLSDEELADFSYSDTYVKFKLLEQFKALGIRGARNGRDQRNPEKYKYYAVKLEPADRVVIKRGHNIYEDVGKVSFNYQSVEDILTLPNQCDKYLSRLLETL